MIFSSITFLCIFLPAFLLCFYMSPRKLKKWIIVLFSILFYAWGAPVFILFLLLSSIFDFLLSKKLSGQSNGRKNYLWISIVLNVGLLIYFKYVNFFAGNVSSIGTAFGFDTISFKEVLLPIGISFFTFQKISYAVDVYRVENKRLDSFIDYLLYIIMFPQLIAGPIVRFKDVSAQIVNYKNNKLDDKLHGLYRFIIGLSKKVFIANSFALIVAKIAEIGVGNMTTADSWLGAVAYTFQIYFDFSGYSDMAIGLGLMIGFKFPENFNFPYLSKSITEFWQRWHITLGTWMRDYLYIPLGGNKVGKMKLYFNLIFVFFISGLWHGANCNFIVWGLFHGVFLIMERTAVGGLLRKLPSIVQVLYTFFVVVISWVIFSMDIDVAIEYLSKMFEFSGAKISFDVSLKVIVLMSTGVVFSFLGYSQKVQQLLNALPEIVTKRKSYLAFVTYPVALVLLILCVIWLMTSGFNPFIYYRF